MSSYNGDMERFWRKVNKDGPGGCWIWTASVNGGGYGHFRLGKGFARAHRYSYELHNGPIPESLCVLHRCDVTRCVNPDHLFLGTLAENVADKMKKGRHVVPCGPDHPNAKLTQRDVDDIRSGFTGRHGEKAALARRYKVSHRVIRNVISGEGYKARGSLTAITSPR